MQGGRNRTPVITARWRAVRVAPGAEHRRIDNAPAKIAVVEIAKLGCADGWMARDHDECLIGRQLHHLTGREENSRSLLPRHHQVAEPGCQPVSCVIALCTQFSCRAERIRYAFGGALVIGCEGHPY